MSKSWRTALAVGMIVAVFAATSAGAAKFITGGDIKNGSIGLKDLSRAAKRGLKGQSGPIGPAGPAGPQGPAGPAAISTTVRTLDITAGGSGLARGEVRCPAGMVATGGAVSSFVMVILTDLPSSDGGGWVGETGGSAGDRARIAVICTPGTATALPTGS
jgi:hypothetical protein